MAERNEGLVVRVTGHEVWVDTGRETIPAVLRGRFRQKGRGIQLAAGDRVEVLLGDSPGTPGAIEALRERRSWLSRYTPRDGAERVIVANIDVLFVVVSIRTPPLRTAFVDRVLVSAEYGHNEPVLCLNKVDLVRQPGEVEGFESVYGPLGYEIIRTSARTGEGLDEVKSRLAGGIYAFVGQSGVGKSSLLNLIEPGLDLRVSGVARKTGHGRHTTTYSQLFAMAGGYVADTPGMQTFTFPGADVAALAGSFREFREPAARCRFQPCTHSHEPDCAVKDALADGSIAESRYESYLAMLEDLEAREARAQRRH